MRVFLVAAIRYLANRLLYAIPVVFLVVSLVFFLIHLVPGDPVQQMLGEGARSADVEQLRRDWTQTAACSQMVIHTKMRRG